MDSFLDALSVDYFEETCRKVFDYLLSAHGFTCIKSDRIKILYSREDVFFDISYMPEDCPRFHLLFGVGFIKRDMNSVAFEGTGLWRALPNDFNYRIWDFTGQKELEAGLEQTRDDVVEKYLLPLCRGPEKLRALIDTHIEEIRLENEESQRSMLKEKALHAYKNKAYGEAAELYAKVGYSGLTPVELKRYLICKNSHEKRSDFR